MPSSVRDAYDRWARTYDQMPNLTREMDGGCLRVALSHQQLGHVPELGCGTGKKTLWLEKHGRVIGLDISTQMLAECRAAAELHVSVLHEAWPIEDSTADTIIVSLVLEHVERLDHIAQEAARVLRGCGRIRISKLLPLRQQEGKRAHFEDEGVLVEPTAFIHTTEEYVTAVVRAGFVLDTVCEPRSAGDPINRPPRLLVMAFNLPDSRAL